MHRTHWRKRPLLVRLSVGVVLTAFAVLSCPEWNGNSEGSPSISREPSWAIVSQHVDPSLGDVTGLDVLRAGEPHPRALTRRPVGSHDWDNQPVWSPDGLHVAFARFYSHSGLYVVDVDGGSPLRLARGSVSAIAWSPDGTAIAFSRACGANPGICRAGISVVNRRGGPVRRVFPSEGLAAWSPDGRRLVCLCTKALWVFSPAGRAPNRLSDALDKQLGPASWSPNGRLIAFGRHCSEGWNGPGGHDIYCDIAVMNIDGSNKRTLLRHGTARGPAAAPPVWSSSQSLLVPRWGFLHGIVSLDVRTASQRLFYKKTGYLYASRGLTTFAVIDSSGLTVLDATAHPLGQHTLQYSWGDLDVHLG
jgi:WD40 repeat protein